MIREESDLDVAGTAAGLSTSEASNRLATYGRNEITDRRAGALAVLLRQLTNPFLLLLVATAVLSIFLHDSSDAIIILCIVVLSVGLSFINEYRSERAVADLRARVRPKTLVLRDGQRTEVNAADLVPGDVVFLSGGDIIPADLHLIEVRDLECDESALTGEAMPQPKSLSSQNDAFAYSGTMVKSGAGKGVVVATGAAARLGSIARELTRQAPQTAFEQGLRGFSMLLVRVTIVLTASMFAALALLHHPFMESLLFALAIAIGLTPQLLPAIVTVSLSFGARQLAKHGVIVKRLVSIEDLGNVEVLFTDKTGTLTEGRVRFRNALDRDGTVNVDGALWGLVCSDVVLEKGQVVHGNAMDAALFEAAGDERIAAASRYHVVDRVPFSYDRQMMSVLVDSPDGQRLLISKGAPERVLPLCVNVDERLHEIINHEFENGNRVIAVASRVAPGLTHIGADDESRLHVTTLLLFADQPKPDARASLERLKELHIAVKILTGDNQRVALSICRQVDIPVKGVLTGAQIAAMSNEQVTEALATTDLFARVTPEQKSRIIRLQRAVGVDVGYLGDGINDAAALHDADVGISVDSAADVAKDAAAIVLLEKDLGVLADGVVEGRRIFANTIKYVLMGTSSNFGNMFSAAGASLFLPFLPMLPSQILLNNLLYDVSEMAIPTDNVDEEQLKRPAHWDQSFIRRFMLFFGPISSLFDFATFAVMLLVFHAGSQLFRSGWFVESLSTQSLVIFLIRTHRVPFFTSKASTALAATTFAVVAIGVVIPFTHAGALLGFLALPAKFFAVLAAMIVLYLLLIELAKIWFYRSTTKTLLEPLGANTKVSSASR